MKVAIAATLLGVAAAVPSYAGVDFTKIKYPAGTGENLHEYPAPPGGWENVKYPPGTGANLPSYPTPPNGDNGGDDDCKDEQQFTSEFTIIALGENVVNGTAPNTRPTPGPEDAVGIFKYQLNGAQDLICYDITLVNVVGGYQSPARTATHIHQAAAGANGPPRIAFPNPEGDDRVRFSKGCISGPFTTGVVTNGADTGAGFRVQQIEDNPAGFFTDSHTALFVPGVVRGQFA